MHLKYLKWKCVSNLQVQNYIWTEWLTTLDWTGKKLPWTFVNYQLFCTVCTVLLFHWSNFCLLETLLLVSSSNSLCFQIHSLLGLMSFIFHNKNATLRTTIAKYFSQLVLKSYMSFYNLISFSVHIFFSAYHFKSFLRMLHSIFVLVLYHHYHRQWSTYNSSTFKFYPWKICKFDHEDWKCRNE